ncbi:BAQ_1a_G0023350.mRNA.1.CDS.1 [Saccharomyces cerevisiae]|nr:BAM_G0023320.mRNA.1.CDS.1 [Saccharomyces cerevisiae]CAI4515153.1 BAQ_1a_G0023350.mRNA.1.CDS.1 [Saccharomyces cerevisiae]CAI7101078.1 BAM_G0023320.mRNA.1.CDS.1 [Saccharomyces cerevisiae]CAI7144844.1 BAQ_1a_G0023350.mRNA.1.CDS.1 [Saccharomyces cerevisiae]
MANNTWKVIATTALISVFSTQLAKSVWKEYKLSCAANKNKTVSRPRQYDDHLFREQLARNYAFLGEEGMRKIKEQYIVIVGAGEVGSWVCTMLIRSGCQKIMIIDPENISIDSLNTHCCAVLSDIGKPKVQCLKEHLSKIAPWSEIKARAKAWTKENSHDLIFADGESPTFIVDCLDNLESKVDLLEYAHHNKIDVISSMGVATKSDPTRVSINDISMTEFDPISRCVRRKLRKRGIATGISVVFSNEMLDPRRDDILSPIDCEHRAINAVRDEALRHLPELGTMPGIFGLSIATWILTKVSGYPMKENEVKNRLKFYDSILETLQKQMARLNENKEQSSLLGLEEVGYIVEEMFRGKSPISGYSTKLALTKWEANKEISLTNVVLMTKEEQEIHEKRILLDGEKLTAVYSEEVLDFIERLFKEEEYYS